MINRKQETQEGDVVGAGVFWPLPDLYLIYHAIVGSVPYARHDWTRTLYFAILIPHSFFAAVMVPFIITAVWLALRQKFDKHRRIVRWLWPVWIFVSLSGIVVYVMLYRL
jgi:uncharacterized membrane protein YozB (DUF420 family)